MIGKADIHRGGAEKSGVAANERERREWEQGREEKSSQRGHGEGGSGPRMNAKSANMSREQANGGAPVY